MKFAKYGIEGKGHVKFWCDIGEGFHSLCRYNVKTKEFSLMSCGMWMVLDNFKSIAVDDTNFQKALRKYKLEAYHGKT